MKSFKQDCQLMVIDFILHMESGPWLPHLVSMPMINRYTFDALVRKVDRSKCVTSHNAIGPFQLTNPFVHDYLQVGKESEAIGLLERLVNINPRFSNIPVYQIQAVIGFIDRVAPLNVSGKSIYQLPADANLLARAFTNNNLGNFLVTMYKRYYGAMNEKIETRVEAYILDFPRQGKFYLETFIDEKIWNV